MPRSVLVKVALAVAVLGCSGDDDSSSGMVCQGWTVVGPTTVALSRADFLSSSLTTSAFAATMGATRAVDVGGGFDLLAPPRPSTPDDVFFPPSMEGPWECQRTIRAIDGDVTQAQRAWQALGGAGPQKLSVSDTETYRSRLVLRDTNGSSSSGYTVVDRGYEYWSRQQAGSGKKGDVDVIWTLDRPNTLQVVDRSSSSSGSSSGSSNNLGSTAKLRQLDVVWRTVELPSDQGWGSQELYKIADYPAVPISTVSSSSFAGRTPSLLRAILVQRRFRRNFDEATGQRVVEGIEVVQTYRVLDGVAGTEFPTSRVKATVRWTRPVAANNGGTERTPPDTHDVPSGAF